ncbi:Plasmodium vivax Vir protein, putative [Plasmodium vivax]|uniref:Vir protein, putative n=2 Tax=Plasmodium vivax TaxID=5855 RepID=A0A1G4E9G1_PLAVI|nr:Plasmodium vivax Vir protein, putative [Plasmodium vivax]
MTKPPGKTLEEAAEAVELHKIHPEKFFSELGESSDFDQLCNGIDKKVSSKSAEVKDLCIKLVRHLVKLSKANPSERNNYCSYIRYWLYEKIGAIHADKSAKIENVPFFKDLNDAWTAINIAKLSNKCKPENIKDVKLDELKNRIFSYIYFKNLEKIKAISNSKKQDDCTKHLTYLENFKSLHDKYKIAQCGSSTSRRSKSFRRYSRTKSFSSCNKLIEFVNCCNYINCVKSSGHNSTRKNNNNNKYSIYRDYSNYSNYSKCTTYSDSRNYDKGITYCDCSNYNKYSHYNQYGNYNKYKKFVKSRKTIIILIFIRSIKANNIRTSIIFRGITNFVKFIKSIGSETLYDKLDSNTIKNIIMAAAVLGIIFFLFYYNRSSRIESSIKPKKRKKKAFEHNYYEEYEKELAKYESENESLDSLEDRYYLTYQPDQDSYY